MSSTPLLIRYPGGDAGRRNGDWIVSRVEANLEGTVNVTVRPAAVVPDDGWPKPYAFITR